MSDRKRADEGRPNSSRREKEEEDRKETTPKSKTKPRNEEPSHSDLVDLKKVIGKHSSQSTSSNSKDRTRNEYSSSDSDDKAGRFKTPARKRKALTPPAPKKDKKSNNGKKSDGSGDEGHKWSRELFDSAGRTEKEPVGMEKEPAGMEKEPVGTEKELKKKIQSLQRKLKGTLKAQTVKISLDLDKKNKILTEEIEALKTGSGTSEEMRHLDKKNKMLSDEIRVLKKGSRSSKDDSKEIKHLEDRVYSLKKERNRIQYDLDQAKSNLERVRKERNEAEDNCKNMKKQMATVTSELRKIRKDSKEKEVEIQTRKETFNKKPDVNVMDPPVTASMVGEKSDGSGMNPPVINPPVGEKSDVIVRNPPAMASKVGEYSDVTDGAVSAVVESPTSAAGVLIPSTQESSQTTAEELEKIIKDFPSDDEWEEKHSFKIGKFIIKNIKHSKESIAINAKLPKKVSKEARRFTTTSLNNRIVFIAMNSKSRGTHEPTRGSQACGLSPVCTRRWTAGDPIASVFIFDSDWNPSNESEVWVCGHHAEASIQGINLQIQTPSKFDEPKEASKSKKAEELFESLDDFKKSSLKKDEVEGTKK